MAVKPSTTWDAAKSAELYKIREWGNGYFDVDDAGEITVSVTTTSGPATVKLNDIIASVKTRGYDTPLQLRFDNIINDRIRLLNESFSKAIDNNNYRNVYRGVFPIKVNQQAHVVDKIVKLGSQYSHGLEAGSLPELLIALALIENPESLIVCNGYKDRDFIDMGLHAIQLGFKCLFVAESVNEIPLIIERSKKMGVEPAIGFRIKLSTRVKGHWEADSGDKSIFGLNVTQMMDAMALLKEADMLCCLELLHCHLGSQLPDIDNIREGVVEACRYYVDLKALGAPLGYLDLGGGLAVDYDGSNSSQGHSKNYSVADYANTIVATTLQMMDDNHLAHPVLITESGRATVAHSSILIFNILEVSRQRISLQSPVASECLGDELVALKDIFEQLPLLNGKNQQLKNEWLKVCEIRADMKFRFIADSIDISTLSQVELWYNSISKRVIEMADADAEGQDYFKELDSQRPDIYYGNFSVFQSLPDYWALEQLFPIMPINRLQEKPDRRGVIADITCDCDGKIDKFIGKDGVSGVLPLHRLEDEEDYSLGVFLVGAYQETLGSLHNLFGDNHVISVDILADDTFKVTHEIKADDCDEVLRTVEYSTDLLLENMRQKSELRLLEQNISLEERKLIVDDYLKCLRGYTYFER